MQPSRMTPFSCQEGTMDSVALTDPGEAWQFDAELWVWDARRADTWVFVTLPPDLSDELADLPRAGFGSVRVEVAVGKSCWHTSAFPDKESGRFVLPIKKAVRRAEDAHIGDTIHVALTVL